MTHWASFDQGHTLTSTCFLADIDGTLIASFKGSPLANPTCHWLVQGNANGNSHIDIIDFTLVVIQFLTFVGADTPCGDSDINTDFDGDGAVTLADYSFIMVNFFGQNNPPCSEVCQP